jgi:hypothetical protein
MPCNDGGDARRSVGRERGRNQMREREKGKEAITVFYPVAEIESPQLQSRKISLLLSAQSILLSLLASVPFIFTKT